MCKLKSGIILKDDIFIPNYNDHTGMLKALKIEDTSANAETLFVRAELSPANGDIFANPATWNFYVDQDIRPAWFVEEYERKRFVAAVMKWWESHVFIEKDDLELLPGEAYWLKACKRVTCHSGTAEAFDSSTVRAFGRSTVKAIGSSKVTAYGSSKVEAFDSSTVKAFDSSTVEAYGSSTVEASGSSTVIIPSLSSNCRENILVLERSTLIDHKTRTVWGSREYRWAASEDVLPGAAA